MGSEIAAVMSVVVGLVGGMVLGAVITHMAYSMRDPYTNWLDRECWVRPMDRESWTRCVVVDASRHGCLRVRDLERPESNGYWIKAENVSWRVRLDDPLR